MQAPLPTTLRSGAALRYLVSGTVAAAVYMAVTTWLNQSLSLDMFAAGFVGYVAAMPCAYLLHRQYSFGSRQTISKEALKFCMLSVASATLSGLIPKLLTGSEVGHIVALIGTSVAVPIFNYLAASLWVFREA